MPDAERGTLLRAVLRRAELRRPRNAIGLPRTLGDAEVEALLLADIAAPSDDALRDLALRRSAAVRAHLLQHGVAAERVFIGAPRIVLPGESEAAAWQPQARLQLSAD